MSLPVAELAALLRERQPCVVLTGAGVSTESGIPDFRSDTGIWAEVDPLEVASIQAFRRDPQRVWELLSPRIDVLLEAEPNAAHLALAELERRNLVAAVVTQNIDTLHSRAGSRDVVEVHGSIRAAVCLACLWNEPAERVLAQLETEAAPLCPHCGEILKPGVTLFGELLPAGAIERATELARSAALMLVVGSSLEVWPVAGLPLQARSFAIVNRGPTALDDGASAADRRRRGGDARGVARGPLAELRREPLREPLAASRERDRAAECLALRASRRAVPARRRAARGPRRSPQPRPADRARAGDRGRPDRPSAGRHAHGRRHGRSRPSASPESRAPARLTERRAEAAEAVAVPPG